MLMSVLAAAVLQVAPTVQDLAWLAGCWETTRGTRHVTEQWMRPEGGTLIGTSRTTSDGKTIEYDIVIREAAGGLFATVEGDINGHERVLEFPYRSADCGR